MVVLISGGMTALAILVARFVAGLGVRQSLLAGLTMLIFLSLLGAALFALRWIVPTPAEVIQGTASVLTATAVVLFVIAFLRQRAPPNERTVPVPAPLITTVVVLYGLLLAAGVAIAALSGTLTQPTNLLSFGIGLGILWYLLSIQRKGGFER